MRTLVAIHAHPDDESSKGAGAVARLAEAGFRCVLVTATGGEAGDILNPAMDHPEVAARLAEVRGEELDLAAKIIGYDEVVKLGYRDSGMPDTDHNSHPEAFANAPFDEVLERLVAIVRRERPSIVFGYDAHERYPHPDHLRVHALSVALVEAAADPVRFPAAGEPWRIARLYAPTFTKSRLLALHEAMIDRGLESPYGDRLERFVGLDDDGKPIYRVDVSGMIERAREALRAHRTQVDPEGHWFAVPSGLIAEVYPWEDFELLAADEGAAPPASDLFVPV
ncbi:MAG TPA: PIG-L family deacetylase [Acidimicrobiia bacterium]|jgi:mycothiol S-conjugate amidase